MTSTSFPLSMASVMSSKYSSSCVTHDFPFKKPCCASENKLFVVMCSTIAFLTSLSINLPGTEVRLIGR